MQIYLKRRRRRTPSAQTHRVIITYFATTQLDEQIAVRDGGPASGCIADHRRIHDLKVNSSTYRLSETMRYQLVLDMCVRYSKVYLDLYSASVIKVSNALCTLVPRE